MNYTVDYFIEKFEKVIEPIWCVGLQNHPDGIRHCAIGLCKYGEQKALGKVMNALPVVTISTVSSYNPYLAGEKVFGIWRVPAINNGECLEYQQPTPKQRILAALYDIKKAQEPKPEVKTVYVTVDQSVRELQKKELSLQ